MHRRLVLAVVLLLIVGACGGGSDDAAPAPAEASGGEELVLLDSDVVEVAEAIATELGSEPGLVAVGYALDRGYTSSRIAAAAAEATLGADGWIAGADPDLAPWGIFSDLPATDPSTLAPPGPEAMPATLTLAADPLVPITADQWTGGLQTEFDAVISGERTPSAPSADAPTAPPPSLDWAGFMTGVIVDLADLGYSADQILLGIVGGELKTTVAPSGVGPVGCWYLEDVAGRAVAPETEALNVFFTTSGCRSVIGGLAAAEDEASEEQQAESAPPAQEEEPADEAAPPGSGGLLDYSLIPGVDGSMTREAITLSIDGDTATLTVNLVFQTAVDYEDETPVCFDNFTMTNGTSNLTVDGVQVSGTAELILNFDGGTQCPQTEQDDIGVPQQVDVSGQIEGGTFVGEFSFEGVGLPFAASVE